MQLTISYRGKPISLTPSPEPSTTLGELRSALAKHLNLPSTNLRLLSQGKKLTEDEMSLSALLPTQATIIILATSASIAATITATDATAARRAEGRYASTPRRTSTIHTSSSSSEYGFGNIESLSQFSDRDIAERILRELSEDRGFSKVMQEKQWHVGALREMLPEGRVGEDPVCVLGYNVNHGQEIRLRLRTDDLTGFRSILSIRHVLCHELAHNEFSEHDNRFKELMRWIERRVEQINNEGHMLKEDSRVERTRNDVSPAVRFEMEDRQKRKFQSGVGRLGEGSSGGRSSGGVPLNSKLLREKNTESEVITKKEDVKTEKKEVQEEEKEDKVKEKLPTETSNSIENKKKETEEKLNQLNGMGFSRRLGQLALRESDGDVSKAVTWILSRMNNEEKKSNESENETVKEMRRCMERLEQMTSSEDMISSLDTLQRYMSNAVRYRNDDRYMKINSNNVGFKTRVGKFTAAVDVLRAVGFVFDDGYWRNVSNDIGRLWIGKEIVEQAFVKSLLGVQTMD